jgi:hypothetical protein
MSSALEKRPVARGEVERIVRRVAELQPASHDARIEHGASLSEIEQLAAKAGLDPTHVRAAALQLYEPEAPGLARRLLGAPTELRLRRVIPRALSVEQLEALVRVVQDEGIAGQVSRVGHTLTWTSGANRSAMRRAVTLCSGAGETTLTFEVDAGELSGHFFDWGAVILVPIALLAALFLHAPVLNALAGVALPLFLRPRKGFRSAMGRVVEQGTHLLDKIAEKAARL